MGQTLSEPQTTKHTSYGEDDRLLFAVSEMQGWRLCECLVFAALRGAVWLGELESRRSGIEETCSSNLS